MTLDVLGEDLGSAVFCVVSSGLEVSCSVVIAVVEGYRAQRSMAMGRRLCRTGDSCGELVGDVIQGVDCGVSGGAMWKSLFHVEHINRVQHE